MTAPRVSVVLTTRDRASILPVSAGSVLGQTLSDLELVIVDDGSTDGTRQVVDGLKDGRVRFLRNETPLGLPGARNAGMDAARGAYIAFLDDDDAWLPDKLALQAAVMDASDAAKLLVYCGCGAPQGGTVVPAHVPTAAGPMAGHIYRGLLLPQSCMLLRTDELRGLGGHSADLASCIDHDMWMKLAQAGFSMQPVQKPLLHPIPHGQEHMVSDLARRIKGIGQFAARWRPVVEAGASASAWRTIRAIYYVQTAETIAHQHGAGSLSLDQARRRHAELCRALGMAPPGADRLLMRLGKPGWLPASRTWRRLPAALAGRLAGRK